MFSLGVLQIISIHFVPTIVYIYKRHAVIQLIVEPIIKSAESIAKLTSIFHFEFAANQSDC